MAAYNWDERCSWMAYTIYALQKFRSLVLIVLFYGAAYSTWLSGDLIKLFIYRNKMLNRGTIFMWAEFIIVHHEEMLYKVYKIYH